VSYPIAQIQARRNYPPAIQAFQVALRANPDEQLLWLRLGEAYSKAGRHSAALKALCRAHELSADDWICTYFIGEVHSQMGKFHDAIEAFESILTERPSEVGVLMSLAQTNLDLGRDEMSTGFLARAEQSFCACVQVAVRAIRETPGFRSLAWKTVADAIFHLSRRTSFVDADNVRAFLEDVASLITGDTSERLSGLLVLPSLEGDSPVGGRQALEVAIIAYDYRISLGSAESMTGSSWYDLGVALNCWSSQTISKEDHERAKKQATECLMKALREDAGNDIFWNALGCINFVAQPKTAQHAYIKALEIDNKVNIIVSSFKLLCPNSPQERRVMDRHWSAVPLPQRSATGE
jgi:superkiller protein 3